MHPSQQADKNTFVSQQAESIDTRNICTGEASHDALIRVFGDLRYSLGPVLSLLDANPHSLQAKKVESRQIAPDLVSRSSQRSLEPIASADQVQVYFCTLCCLMMRQRVAQVEDIQDSPPEADALATKKKCLYRRQALPVTAIESILGDLADHLIGSFPTQAA